jgi:hypothetical protein
MTPDEKLPDLVGREAAGPQRTLSCLKVIPATLSSRCMEINATI